MAYKKFVSVLVPAFNEEECIGRCLESLLMQSYPEDCYEVIVMDNGSTDNTKSVCIDFGVKVIDASSLLIGGVRNLGAEYAKGEVFAYIDADCIAPPEWIKNGVNLLISSEDIGAVGGNCDIRENATWVEKAWVLNRPIDESYFRNILATGSFFVRKHDFHEVGRFNPAVRAGEDTDISRKLIENGKKLIYSTDIRVVHLGFPRTVTAFIKRQIWQSSDYLETRKSGIDEVFILVHVFLFSLFGSLVFLFIDLSWAVGVFAITIFSAIALGVYRYYKSSAKLNILLFLEVIMLNYLYLCSRTFGLLNAYLSVVKSKTEKLCALTKPKC